MNLQKKTQVILDDDYFVEIDSRNHALRRRVRKGDAEGAYEGAVAEDDQWADARERQDGGGKSSVSLGFFGSLRAAVSRYLELKNLSQDEAEDLRSYALRAERSNREAAERIARAWRADEREAEAGRGEAEEEEL